MKENITVCIPQLPSYDISFLKNTTKNKKYFFNKRYLGDRDKGQGQCQKISDHFVFGVRQTGTFCDIRNSRYYCPYIAETRCHLGQQCLTKVVGQCSVRKLTDDAIAWLYVTNCSTIFL